MILQTQMDAAFKDPTWGGMRKNPNQCAESVGVLKLRTPRTLLKLPAFILAKT